MLGLGREAPQPQRDVIQVTGDLVIPVDLRNIAFWLEMLLGTPAVTGTGPYTRVFTSGAATLPSFTVEIGHPRVPSFQRITGCMVNTLRLQWQRSGKAQATLGLIAQAETLHPASGGGTPAIAALTQFNPFQSSLKKDGSALGNITQATLTYSNGLAAVETIRPDGLIEGIDPGPIRVSGELRVRFADTGLMTTASSGTPVALELGYVIDANGQLLLALPEVYLPRPKLPVQGPAGIEATFAFEAALHAGTGHSLTATLVNDVA